MLKQIINSFSQFGLFALLFIGCDKKSSHSTSEQITLLPNNVISSSSDFIGGGVEWSAYPHADAEDAEWGLLMTEEKWNTVFNRLDFMQPKIVRVLDQANWRYLEGMDKEGNPVLDFENEEMQALYKLLDYCEKNNIQVILGEWGQPYKVHDTNLNMQNVFTGATDPKWISIIADHLQYLIKEKGYKCIQYYNLVNEPNGYWSSIDGNWEEWKDILFEFCEKNKRAPKHKEIYNDRKINNWYICECNNAYRCRVSFYPFCMASKRTHHKIADVNQKENERGGETWFPAPGLPPRLCGPNRTGDQNKEHEYSSNLSCG